ncbi:MAG: metallophosphoesterase, partial [Bacteroidetes bacterium]|nr:metallophosphoesterase [Bacteroidota bacterium]
MKKTFVIGDIHGCYDELIELLEKVEAVEEDTIISLGDIVDRGNKSLETYQFFHSRKNAVVLMGNHERKHLRGILSYLQEIVKLQFGGKYPEFLEWLGSLPYSIELEEATIVHAFFEHDKPLSAQKEDVLAGTTSGSRYLEEKYPEGTYWRDFYQGEKPVIYGHHVVGDEPKIENNTYGIDTGACHGGMLTAIELPGFRIHQIRVKTDYWAEERRKWQIPVLKAKDWENMEVEKIKKQIQKLAYKQESELRLWLENLEKWVTEIEGLYSRILRQIQLKTEELEEEYGENFNRKVSQLNYRTFIFKHRA